MSFSDHLHCKQLAIKGLLSFMKHRECLLYPVYKTMYLSSQALATSSPLTLKVFSAHLQNTVKKKMCQNWHGSSHLQSGGLFCECSLSRFNYVLLFVTLWTVLGILRARILEWVAMLSSKDLPDQDSNPHRLCLLHCRWILYH